MKSNRILLVAAILVVAALLTACQPITAENMQNALAGQSAATEAAATDAAQTEAVGSGATATVTAQSLRVRAEPSESAEVVAGVRQGEVYDVIGRSSDGLWLEIAVPQSAAGSGWVSANFVTVSGSITDTEVSAAPTPVPTQEATAEATEAPAEEPIATAEPTEEAAAEATATEAATEEPIATAEPTEEAAAEATATEAAAEEPVATAEPTEEAAAEATATEAATEEPAAEATPAITPPAPGFALVIAEGARLRVRAEQSLESEIIGWVQPGEVVPVEEVSADGLWVKLAGVPDTENPNGGWVSAEFVVLGQ